MTKHTERSLSTNLELLATVSHEIRNPLNAIVGISRLLKLPASDEDREKYVDGLVETSEHLLDLLNNIMDFSKLESDSFILAYEPTDLHKTITQNLVSQKAIAESKNLEFKIEIDKKLPPSVITDPVKISQVILNLISNAIKFTESGMVSLKVEVLETGNSEVVIKFRVTDTGIGIPEESLQAVLEPFHQGTFDTNMNYGGTGLGLSISKKIINKMGGELEVQSELSKGSEFSFSLKLDIDRSSERLITPDSSFYAANFQKGVKVLVVDDNKMNVLVAQKNLEFWGFDFQTASNGISAVEKIQKEEFDIVLMDLHMPQMNGLEATKLVRKLPGIKYQELPIIGFTASTEKFLQENLSSAGFTDLLNKPFRPEELFNKIITHIKPGKPVINEPAEEKVCDTSFTCSI